MIETKSAFQVQFDQAETIDENRLDRVLAQLTHEMSEPLGAIDSIAYYLRMVLPKEDERTHHHLERIEQLVAAMNGTLGDALQYLHAAPSEPRPLDLHQLLTDVLAERAPGSEPTFTLHPAPGPAPIRMDCGQARQLLRSLLNSFRRWLDRCREVEIFVRTDGSQVTLEFQAAQLDATRQEVEAMFVPFGAGFADGAGLALASARRIFEANGGRISARSDTGRGLSLRGALPLAV